MHTPLDSLIVELKAPSITDEKPPRGPPIMPMMATPTLQSDDARVYCEYDSRVPPPHPGSDWTRFICLSDTHGHTFPVPPGDVLIHAGDLSQYGSPQDLEATVTWLQSLPHPVKLVIAGNHDDLLDVAMFKRGEIRRSYLGLKDVEKARALMTGPKAIISGLRYLQYEHTSILSPPWNVYGSPGTPFFSAGAFQYSGRTASKEINNKIPNNTQILITHGPPLNILDRTRHGVHGGCPDLYARLFSTTDSTPSNDHSNNASSGTNPHPAPRSSLHSSQSPPSSHSNHQGVKRQSKHTNRTTTTQLAQDTEATAEDWLPHVRLHVFGHIHDARGALIRTRERRRPRHPPPPTPTPERDQNAQRSHRQWQPPHSLIAGDSTEAPPLPPQPPSTKPNQPSIETNSDSDSRVRYSQSFSLPQSFIGGDPSIIALDFGEALSPGNNELQPSMAIAHVGDVPGDHQQVIATSIKDDEDADAVVERVDTVFVNAAGRNLPPIIVDLHNVPVARHHID